MSKVITFSRHFQKSHPKAGEPTYFIEQILNSLGIRHSDLSSEVSEIVNDFFILDGSNKKHHTIRSGNRFKVGDKFSPRVWSGKPYASKQIVIAPDLEINKVYDIEVNCRGGASWFEVIIGDKVFAQLHHGYDKDKNVSGLTKLALNDGLELEDFKDWFYSGISVDKPFKGQIICWSDQVNY